LFDAHCRGATLRESAFDFAQRLARTNLPLTYERINRYNAIATIFPD
jgi:hypothetical protein